MFRHVKPLLNCTLTNTFKASVRHSNSYTPRRACMYVPGNDEKMIQKALTLDVDCIILDCEDGVAVNKKEHARENIRALFDKGKPAKKRKYDLAVRVNGAHSGLLRDDCSKILTGKNLPDTIFLPKVDTHDDLISFSDHIKDFIKPDRKISLMLMVESALSVINLIHIVRKAKEMTQKHKFVLVGLLFGSDDYCASIGAHRSESCFEVIYARQKIVTVAKAFNLQAIDMVYIKYQDLEGLEKQAREGNDMGFSGKQIIHPGQVEITQKTFMPSQEEIEWAMGVIDSFHKHQTKGKGAFVYKEAMIDMPTMRQAQNIVDLVNTIMMHHHSNHHK